MHWSVRMIFLNGPWEHCSNPTTRTHLVGHADLAMQGEFPERLFFPPNVPEHRADSRGDVKLRCSLWKGSKTPDRVRHIDLDTGRVIVFVGNESFETEVEFQSRMTAYRENGWKIDAAWTVPPVN